MTKTELINRISEANGITKKIASESVEMVLGTICDVLESGENVELHNFGNFKIVARDSRVGRNPKTNEEITIPAHKVVTWKATKALRDAVK